MSGRRGLPAHPIWERFWSKVDQSGGPDACWPWTGAVSGKQRSGYGKLSVRLPTGRHRLMQAHWLAYTFLVGPVPPGARVLHTCGMRICMQPAHLLLSEHTSDHAMIRSGMWLPRRVEGQRNGRAKITEDDVRAIRRRRARNEPLVALAMRFGLSQSAVGAVWRGVTWKQVV